MSQDYRPGAGPGPDLSQEEGEQLRALDLRWRGGQGHRQEIERTLERWRQRLGRPPSQSEERFDVVDPAGEPLGWSAPRWFCHLTGLRHRGVHLLLRAPQGLWLLQKRARSRPHWPGCLEVSASGHLKAGQSWSQAAWEELREEIGLLPRHLEAQALHPIAAPYERYDQMGAPGWLRNRQMNQPWTGTLTAEGLAALKMEDGEVEALLLCRDAQVQRLVDEAQGLAPGLLHTWPRLLRWRAP